MENLIFCAVLTIFAKSSIIVARQSFFVNHSQSFLFNKEITTVKNAVLSGFVIDGNSMILTQH